MTVRNTALRMREGVRAILKNRSGSALPLFAALTPVLLGALGISVDVGVWYSTKRVVETSADAAAIAAAYRLAEGDSATMIQAAQQDAVRNGFVAGAPSTMAVRNPPASGAYAGNPAAVEVALSERRPLMFSSLFLQDGVTISARAVAMAKVTGDACVLALDPTAAGAVTVQGSTTVDMSHCAVAANSSDPGAIAIGGNAALTADTLWTAGNYTVGNSTDLSLQQPATTNAWPLTDPFADTQVPPLGGCTANHLSFNGVTQTISPGVYCNGLGIGSQSTVTLNPGTYYIDGGNLSIAAQATVTCACSGSGDGVTIVLTSSSGANQIGRVIINGGANVTLNAPSDPGADFPGLLFFQDPRATATQPSKFDGGATMNLTGGIYFPAQQIEWTGNNSSGTPTCTKIVAKIVVFTGNSNTDNSGCAAAGVNPIQIQGIALVE